MLVLGMGLLWAGYAIASWGYILVKGWNITFTEWVSPLHPYTWPPNKGQPPKIPPGTVWPSAHPTLIGMGAVEQQLVTPGAA